MKLVNTHIQFILILLILNGFHAAKAEVWTLQQCIDTAQVHNKNLLMSRNTVAIGEQKEKEAKAGLIPKITANADYKYFTNLPYQLLPLSTFSPTAPEGQFKDAQFGVPHNISAAVQLTLPLYNPQLYGAIETAKIASELTELQYQKTEEYVFFEISNLYYTAQILHHQLAFTDSNLINAMQLLKTMQLLKEQLLAKGTDVSKVQLQTAQLQTQKITLNSKREQVLNALKFAMGIPAEQSLEVQTDISYTEFEAYPETAVLDVQIASTQKRLLQNEIKTLNRSRYLPSLNMMASYGTTGFGYDKAPNDFIRFYPLGFAGIQLSYPLFNGTVTLRKIKQKKLELQNNAIQVQLYSEQNDLQLQNARLQKISAQSSVETTEEQIKLAQTVYTQTILQQKQGMAALTDVLLADNALREAQQTYLNTVVEYLKAELDIRKNSNQLRIKN